MTTDPVETLREALKVGMRDVSMGARRLIAADYFHPAEAALAKLVDERDYYVARSEEAEHLYDRMEARAEAAEAERDALREAAISVVDEYHKWSEDANDGEFALWRREDLVNAIIALRATLGEATNDAA